MVDKGLNFKMIFRLIWDLIKARKKSDHGVNILIRNSSFLLLNHIYLLVGCLSKEYPSIQDVILGEKGKRNSFAA